ncbi:MAG: hypothetical protein JWN90_202 [Parcubacteria group bacterium]|nr:hypothetical protein [Parcubacteria group bacterium]
MKQIVWIGLLVGSTIGGFIPELWGAGVFSFSSIILSAIGGMAGIYLGWKIAS